MRVDRPWKRLLTGVTLAVTIGTALLWTQKTSRAQVTEDSKGTDFWLMFNTNYSGGPALSLFITGDVATTGTVSVPGLSFTQNFSIVPGTVTTVTVPAGAMASATDGVENKGIHVTANAEVTVYGLNRIQFTTDAFLGLPTDILGTEHIVLSYPNGYSGPEFGVVGTQASTTLTITPATTIGARAGGVPYNITLNQGQTYQLHATTGDPTGTVIVSDKPVAVFGGNACANVPTNHVACDHIIEQIPPTSTWGQSFVTMPLATRLNGDTFRILASEAATTVMLNGAAIATLNKGQVHERIIAGPATITANHPILVAQYSNGSSYDGVTSDPFMMLIPPYEQFLGAYTVTTPASGFSANFINVVAPTSAVGSVLLDGVAIPAGAFTAIGTSGFSGAQRSVALGSHTLSGPLPFGAFMYGFDSYDSYGYPGGLALGEVASVTNIVLSPASATNPINTQHCLDAAVTDQNGAPLSGIRVDFSVTGAHTTSGFGFTAATGIAQFCYTGTVAGTDSIVGNVGTVVSNTATKTWTSQQAVTCDVDGDRDVDLTDINAINAARNTTAAPGDPRDANGDGTINVVDSRFCVVRCTRAGCAVN